MLCNLNLQHSLCTRQRSSSRHQRSIKWRVDTALSSISAPASLRSCTSQRNSTNLKRHTPAKASLKEATDGLETARQLTRDERRDVAYREGAVYLRTLGIDSQTELTRVLDIAMNPNSLFVDRQSKLRPGNDSARLLSVEEDMKPVVKYFTSLGLSTTQVRQVILLHPPVISYSATKRLAPFLESLETMGLPDPIQVVLRRPSLLGLSNRDNLSRIVSYLLDSGHSMEEVAEMVATSV